MHQLPKPSLPRWIAFGALCVLVGATCFVDRFPLISG